MFTATSPRQTRGAFRSWPVPRPQEHLWNPEQAQARHAAFHDPGPDRQPEQAGNARRPVEGEGSSPYGDHQPADERAKQPELERDAELDQGEVGARVIEDHHLVHHRELEMGGGIIEGNPGILGKKDYEERSRNQHEPASHRAPERGGEVRIDRAEGALRSHTAGAGQTDEGHHGGRLCESGEEHLPARPHALEGRACIEGGQDGHEADERQQVENDEEIAPEVKEGRRACERDQTQGSQGCGQGEYGTRREHPARGPTVDAGPLEQLDQVEVAL